MVEPILALAAPGGTAGNSGNPAIGMFVTLGLMVLVFYFLLIRPQRREQTRHQEMLRDLKRNDRVVTSGGLMGKVINVTDDKVTLEIANKVRIDVLRSAISGLQSGSSDESEE